MRLVQVVVPAGKRRTVLRALDEEGIDYVLTEEVSNREYDVVVSFPLPTNAVEQVLEELREAGIERDAYTVVTEAQTVASKRFEQLTERFAEEESETRIAREELKSTADNLASAFPSYVALTVVSAVIATAGLLLDSPATVVGSMVIAPLIGPAMAAAVGTVIDDDDLFSRGVRMQLVGMALAVVAAAVFAFGVRYLRLIPPTLDPVSLEQVRERLAPDFLSLAVALGAGVAGALSLTTGVSSALVGVMIAVALVPPAATVGIGIAYGLPTVAVSAGVLAVVNGLSINLAALLVLWYSGYRPERFFRISEARSATLTRVGILIAAIALLSVFLGGVTYDSYSNALADQEIRDAVGPENGVLAQYERYSLLGVSVERERTELFLQRPARVVVTVGVPPDAPPNGLADDLDAAVDAALGYDVRTQVRYVTVEAA